MVFPKPEETAILIVDGSEFRDWESVMVKRELKVHPYIHFRFTCSEGMPLAGNWAALRILPGMVCSVILGGELACTGQINTRQVFYDARRHYVELQGASDVVVLAGGSVVHKTMEFKNVNYTQFASAVVQPFGISFVTEGMIPDVKFERINVPPGQLAIEALEDPLRHLGNVNLKSNPQGNLVAVSGTGSAGDDTLTEGVNILEGKEIIYNVGMAQGTYGVGQRTGNDQTWGAKVASIPYFGNAFQSLAARYAPHVSPLEIPAWQNSFLQNRTGMERDVQAEDQVTLFITVQGWLRPSGGLWTENQTVRVISPMLVWHGEPLYAKSVTFTQDNFTGSRTVLELMNANALQGLVPAFGGNGGLPSTGSTSTGRSPGPV